jgi:hypothetical protein
MKIEGSGKVGTIQKTFFELICFFRGILRSMMKLEGSASGSASESGSGSISQRHGSADLDPHPDLHQSVMDPEHCLKKMVFLHITF